MPTQELPLLPALAALVCLLGFTVVAGIDGVYYHLHLLRLHTRPDSHYEHRLHTLNSVLFVPQVLLLFVLSPQGLLLWLGLLLMLGSFVLEILDVLCEEESRRSLGGLSRREYLMHFLMSALHLGFMLPLLCATLPEAWRIDHTALLLRPTWLLVIGAWIGGPAVLVAGLHVVLDVRGRRSKGAAA